MDDISCPRCKTTKYRNPSLKLLVNVCGHSLCENCVQTMFIQGSGECPQCHVTLRRTNFRVQMFEDTAVEKDVDIRRRILRDFNKKEEDFVSLLEYNDYLELVETIIYNQTNGLDVDWTKAQIEKYRQENEQTIKRNRTRMSKEEEWLEQLIEEEQEEREINRRRLETETSQAKLRKQRQSEQLIDDLAKIGLPAEEILRIHRQQRQRDDTTSTTTTTTKLPSFKSATNNSSNSRSIPSRSNVIDYRDSAARSGNSVLLKSVANVSTEPREVAAPFVYTPLELRMLGPKLPEADRLNELGYLRHVREASTPDRVGGFVKDLACERALQDAFNGLYLNTVAADNNSVNAA